MAREAMTTTSTLSLKEIQRCFDKERHSFLSDLETMRQQLVKKDQSAARAAAAASAHVIQLKREIATFQTTMAAVEAERTKFQEQYMHTSSLLETALDQRHEDQAKLKCLNSKLRLLEKKHEETIELIKSEAASNVRATHDERQALRARIDQLKGKLERERKEWQTVHYPMSDQLQKSKTRLQLIDKELQEARYRERSNFQLKEKMGSEVTMYKQKIADLSTALQEALYAKSGLKDEHALTVRYMKSQWRELLRDSQHSKDQFLMLQEDYNALFRSRTCIERENEQLYQTMEQRTMRHEQAVKVLEKKCFEMEKENKSIRTTCPQCLQTPEQKQLEEEIKLASVREQTRLEVTKVLELERWSGLQEINSKYLDTNQQLQNTVKEYEMLQSKCKTLDIQREELQETEHRLSNLLEEAQAKILELTAQRDEGTQQIEATKKTMQGLVQNLMSLTAVTADQSTKLQELESARRGEHENLMDQIRVLEADKQSIAQDHEQHVRRYEELVVQYELLKQEKLKNWNEIVEAQLSANLLIEEQAHTIDDLLQAKANGDYDCPSKTKLSSNCARIDSIAASDSYAGQADANVRPEHDNSVVSLRQECKVLREEVDRLKQNSHDEWLTENKKKESEFLREIKSLQTERQKLKKRLEEQALTIHELTLQEEDEAEDASDEEDNESQSYTCNNEQIADRIDVGLSSCADSFVSPNDWRGRDSRQLPAQNLTHRPEDKLWSSSDTERQHDNHSICSVSAYGSHDR